MTEPGASTIELLLALVMHLVDRGQLSRTQAIAALTSQPANILGIDAGSLSVGAPADVCIVDIKSPWQIERDKLASMGRNTPFSGWEMSAQVITTLVNGKQVYTRKH